MFELPGSYGLARLRLLSVCESLSKSIFVLSDWVQTLILF